ncbi:MAG: carbon-nitrogen hydrolase family protein [Pseudomonadota bacterium]
MRLAAAAYPLDYCQTEAALADKLSRWVADAADAGAELLLFPEYAGMELTALAGPEAAQSLTGCIDAATDRIGWSDALHADLARAHNLWIAAGSLPVRVGDRVVNRTRLFGPAGQIAHQDKLIPTPYERDPWCIDAGQGAQVFDIGPTRIGIVICYDAEFPLIARAMVEAGAEILLVPSATETVAGYWRVRIGAMARALEGQCVVAHAPLVGPAPWSPPVDLSRGAAGIYGPPDLGFPETGLLALGEMNTPGWVFEEADLAAIATVRHSGHVRGHAHWPEQRWTGPVPCVDLTKAP